MAPPRDDDPFYIGYDPPMPRPIARVVTRAVAGLVAAGLAGVALVAAAHRPVASGVFEFGTTRTVSGIVTERPYPALQVSGRSESTLLVGTGKHGAAARGAGHAGRRVTIPGQLIARDGHQMLEITGGVGLDPAPGEIRGPMPAVDADVVLRGEVVDSKCFLGVMTPGQGKTHRACASLCLRGGIPPALFVEDRDGASRLVLLVSATNGPLDPAGVADRAFEPTEMTGTLTRQDGWWVLRTDPTAWRRLSR
jgi:hypothetical protein